MRRQAMRVVGMMVGVALVLSGCAAEPDEEESVVSVEQMQEKVSTAVLEVADALEGAGLQVPTATGRYEVCGTEPISSVQYRALIDLSGPGDTASQVQRAAESMEQAGWTITDSGTERGGWSDLERDELAGSVQVSQGDDGAVNVSVVHPCVDAARTVVDEVFGQTDQIIG